MEYYSDPGNFFEFFYCLMGIVNTVLQNTMDS